MKTTFITVLLAAAAVLSGLSSQAEADPAQPLEFAFDTAGRWAQQNDWVSPVEATANFSINVFGDGVGLFGITEAGKEMRWSTKTEPSTGRYLIVRYQASKLHGDGYMLWGGWLGNPQWVFLRPADLIQDGTWRLVAVDLEAFGVDRPLSNFAVRVAAGAETPATLWLDYIRFADVLPEGATLIAR